MVGPADGVDPDRSPRTLRAKELRWGTWLVNMVRAVRRKQGVYLVVASMLVISMLGVLPTVSSSHVEQDAWEGQNTMVSPNLYILAFIPADECDPSATTSQVSSGVFQDIYDLRALNDDPRTITEDPNYDYDAISDGTHTFGATSEATLRLGVEFYVSDGDDCNEVGDAAEGLADVELTGQIPEGAEFMEVRAWGGFGQYTIGIPGPPTTCADSPFC